MSMEWAVFFSLTLSLLIAILFVVFSGYKGGVTKYNRKYTTFTNVRKWFCFLIGGILLIFSFGNMPDTPTTDYYYLVMPFPDYLYISQMKSFICLLCISLGLIGNGVYLNTDADVVFSEDEELTFENS